MAPGYRMGAADLYHHEYDSEGIQQVSKSLIITYISTRVYVYVQNSQSLILLLSSLIIFSNNI